MGLHFLYGLIALGTWGAIFHVQITPEAGMALFVGSLAFMGYCVFTKQ